MTETPAQTNPAVSIHTAFIHDLRNTLFAIQLTPLLLEKHRGNPKRFEEICRGILKDCGTLAALIEEEFGEDDENGTFRQGEPHSAERDREAESAIL